MGMSITASNSSFAIVILGLYPVPQVISGYSMDAAFENDAQEMAEVQKGVDGKISAGFTPTNQRMSITLQANSESITLFENWQIAMKIAREIYWADAIIRVPSVGKSYACTNGVLRSFPSGPNVRKVMAPRVATIEWDDVTPSPF